MAGFDPKQLQEMVAQAQRQAQDLQAQMERTVVEASAGGGTVTVRMNGKKQVLAVKIEPEAVNAGDVEMLQDLITAAVNEANRKVDAAIQSQMGNLLGGMGLGM